jgi:2-dehydropantoate 2-reductase
LELSQDHPPEPGCSAVINECSRVVAAEGYPPTPDIPSIIRRLFSQPESTYGPSLLVDMEEGRATEGEYTIGDLVKRAARCGISAPILGAALCNLQAFEINRKQVRPEERSAALAVRGPIA